MNYRNVITVKILLLLVLWIGCTPARKKAEETEHPNIVWITSEDNSKHYMKLFDENGVSTPNIEALAKDGITFTHAFSNAPVCSAARSTLISGCYGPRLASHYHRKIKQVPMPYGLQMFPAYLKKAGYHTTNKAKEDYNIIKSDDVWDMSSKKATWRDRKKGQPFFHVVNFNTTHESRIHFSSEDFQTKQTSNNPNDFKVQPNHPQTELLKYTNAHYRDKIQQMDKQVGKVVQELKKDGLLESTFIFYYGDHGGVLPGSKGYIFETGLHIPLVVYVPSKYKHLVGYHKGSIAKGFVSFTDFGATVLSLAGIEIPKQMDGKPFLGKSITAKEVEARDETYSYADRFDEKYDMVRGVRKGKYKYIRNYQPFNFDGLRNNYRYKQLAYKEWVDLYNKKQLNKIQSAFFETKEPEYLFDVEADPFETNNLAKEPQYAKVLKQMRSKLNTWESNMPDLSFYPEFYLIQNVFDNPVAFGQTHKRDIAKYIKIADLALENYQDVTNELKANLKSKDPWTRYWALTVCSSFGQKANELKEIISHIAQSDNTLINKVRAAEFLGLTNNVHPAKVMTDALYQSKDGVEALQILNSIVLMRDGKFKYQFDIKAEKLDAQVKNEKMVLRRLEYLNTPQPVL